MKKKTNKIARDSNLGEVVFRYPQTAELLLDWGLHCVGCGGMSFDTVEAGAKIHGFTDKEIDDLLTRLNEVVEFNE